jgi:hypothetical protein
MKKSLLFLIVLSLLVTGCYPDPRAEEDADKSPMMLRIDRALEGIRPNDVRNSLEDYASRNLTEEEQLYLCVNTLQATILSSHHKADVLEVLAGNPNLTAETYDFMIGNLGQMGVPEDEHRVKAALKKNRK